MFILTSSFCHNLIPTAITSHAMRVNIIKPFILWEALQKKSFVLIKFFHQGSPPHWVNSEPNNILTKRQTKDGAVDRTEDSTDDRTEDREEMFQKLKKKRYKEKI